MGEIKTLKKFQVARGCQTDACKFYSGRETIDMKAVVNHSVIISGKCNKLNVSNEHSSNEASITVYKLTVRKLCK